MRAPGGASWLAMLHRTGLGHARRPWSQRALHRNTGQGDSPAGPAGGGKSSSRCALSFASKAATSRSPGKHGAGRSRFSFSTQPALGSPDTATLDLAFWESVKSSNSSADFRLPVAIPGARLPPWRKPGCATEGGRVGQGVGAADARATGHAGGQRPGLWPKNSVAVTISQSNDQRTVYSSGDIMPAAAASSRCGWVTWW